MFLPDRYVKGICPICGTPDQYGDSCEVCGSTYTPADLKNPFSVVSGTTPVARESEHYFFRLERVRGPLAAWVGSGAVQESVARKLEEWFSPGPAGLGYFARCALFRLRDPRRARQVLLCLVRCADRLPGELHAAVRGSAASISTISWTPDSTTELHHFIGKDILYFHALFWPAVLEAAGMRRPTAVHAHGFVTINGQKMSKSRGTFITARRYLDSFMPEYLRYYFAAKLGPASKTST